MTSLRKKNSDKNYWCPEVLGEANLTKDQIFAFSRIYAVRLNGSGNKAEKYNSLCSLIKERIESMLGQDQDFSGPSQALFDSYLEDLPHQIQAIEENHLPTCRLIVTKHLLECFKSSQRMAGRSSTSTDNDGGDDDASTSSSSSSSDDDADRRDEDDDVIIKFPKLRGSFQPTLQLLGFNPLQRFPRSSLLLHRTCEIYKKRQGRRRD